MQSTPPLLIEDTATGLSEGKRGTLTRRVFKIRNIGPAPEASVNFWLETDRKSEVLLNWGTFNPNPPIKIAQGELCEVILSFEIPLQAPISLYNYTIVIEALQYADVVRRPMQLQIQPLEQDSEIDLDPGFTLEPITTSTQPYPLASGETLAITVQVENRSKLTDRYYLACSDLPPDWYTIQYPESAIERFGIIQETEGLQLNPETVGEIVMQIHPPPQALAGTYFPTLRLTSRNREDLMLLDVVYLQLLPDLRLEAHLTPGSRRIPEEPAQFDLRLTNLGNLQRQLTVTGQDGDRLFRYIPIPEIVRLAPGESQSVTLQTQPRRWWKRPLKSPDLKVPFEVGLQEPLPADSRGGARAEALLGPVPQVLPQGTLVWLPRPWWVAKLLWLLLLLPLIGLAGLLLYLWFNRPKPLPPPEIALLAPDQIGQDYQEGKAPIRLNWQINGLAEIDQVTVIRLEKNVETYRKSYFFNRPGFEGALPDHLLQENKLNNFCTEKALEPQPNGVLLRLNGSHRFLGIPYPYISREMVHAKALICRGIITPTDQAGSYNFQLQVFQRPNTDQPVSSETTDTIIVRPNQDPQIVQFASDRLIYNETPGAAGLVRLNWQILNPSRIEELQLVTLSPDGTAQGELKRYPLVNGALPAELQAFCRLGNQLVCTNLPTDVQKSGNYIFKLVLRVKPASAAQATEPAAGSTEVVRQTEPIKVIAKPIRIVSFLVNGQSAKQHPKQTYLFNRRVNPPAIALSWQVEGGADTEVELLPAPGQVPLQGTMNLMLNAPGTQTVTLRAKNTSGEQQEQSIVIQLFEVPDPSQAGPSDSPATAPAAGANPADQTPPSKQAAPAPIGNPEPIELPPRAN